MTTITPAPIAALPAEITTRLTTARDEAIAKLQADARERGQPADRAFWAVVYDFELAPMTTNIAMLEMLGITLPPASEIPNLSPEATALLLRTIINGLATWNVFLLHTNHLSDTELLTCLLTEILPEEVQLLPPSPELKEFVDCCIVETDEQCALFEAYYGDSPTATPAVDRDATLPKPEGF